MNIRTRLAKLELQKSNRGIFSHLSDEELADEIRDNNLAIAEGLALKLGITAGEVTLSHLLLDCDIPELAEYLRDEMSRGPRLSHRRVPVMRTGICFV